jgi:hypothetical protein
LAYDEQIGLTFTQSFTSMEYNVTAVEQTDPTLGDGPAYLLNGLSNSGYWYQVGVSWDWAPGQSPGTGFDMNYEVFDNSGNSIFPANGQGGIQAFSGPVRAGDAILLDLYFSNAGQVVMLAEDTETGAMASVTYPNMGGTYFVGLPSSTSDQNGFFTGLMTEWYHGVPYYANEADVIYSDYSYALSSAWMWMDEFNAQSFQGVFSANTSAPISYGNPTKLQEFAFNGTTEYSDAYEFVTGSLTNATQPTSSTITLTLSYVVNGGGTGYSPPVLGYVLNGTPGKVPLTNSPTVYRVDIGTTWSVSAQLSGSASGERWETDQPTSGPANASMTVQFTFYAQDYIVFGFSVTGGGSGFSPPTITYASFGESAMTTTGAGVWADVGSRYQYSSLLPGSTSTERWFTRFSGSVSSPGQINATYYNQYLVDFDISFPNTELFPGLSLKATSAGQPYSATAVSGANKEWLDSGSAYSLPQSLALGTGDRMITNGSWTGEVTGTLVVPLTYLRQFYITITPNTPGGGTLSPPSGWYDSGSKVKVDATPAPGWRFQNWEGVGADSVSSLNSSFFLTVGPGAPADETAVFYAGITIYAVGPMPISYSDGSISGTVHSGAQTELYVPSSSTLNLAASGVPLLDAFRGWSGASNSTNTVTTAVIYGPARITANSEYNYIGIGILVLSVVLVAIAGTFVLIWRRRSKGL